MSKELGPYVPLPNSGMLFTVEQKRTHNWPDVNGDMYLSRDLLERVMQQEGELVKMSISAWRKQSKITGKKYLSLAIGEPYEKKTESQKQEPQDDEDVPF
jgi:hypothetical protein